MRDLNQDQLGGRGFLVFAFVVMQTVIGFSGGQAYALSCTEIFAEAKTKRKAARRVAMPKTRLKLAERITELSDTQFIDALEKLHPDILMLTGKVDATPGAMGVEARKGSPSEARFGEKHIEYDRTVNGLLILKWTLEGNYEKVVEAQVETKKPDILQKKTFDKMRGYTRSYLSTPEAIDAMIAYLVINDLTKVKAVISDLRVRFNIRGGDHDEILYKALKKVPTTGISESFEGLSKEYQATILAGMRTGFNMGQFMRGENVAASLEGLHRVNPRAYEFYMIHFLFDLAGAVGQVYPNGSFLLGEGLFSKFESAYGALVGLRRVREGRPEEQAVQTYLSSIGKRLFGFDSVETKEEMTITRLALHADAMNPKDAGLVRAAYENLAPNVKAILEHEMTKSGIHDGIAIRVYYAPDIVGNARTRLKENGDGHQEAYQEAFTTLARAYLEARIELRNLKKKKKFQDVHRGEFTLHARDLSTLAGEKNPGGHEMRFTMNGIGLDVRTMERQPIPVARYPKQDPRFSELGDRVGFVAIGGGSDNRQAIQVGASILHKRGKETPFFISVRSARTGSQGASGKVGEERTVENPKQILEEDVYEIGPETRGSGRWMEHLSADQFRVFYVIDRQDGTLTSKLRRVIDEVNGVTDIVAIDTGGDSAYDVTYEKVFASRATPDQDLRVLDAMTHLQGVAKLHSWIVAPGLDVPRDARVKLSTAGARHYQLSNAEGKEVLDRYREWELDGTHPERYGKTSFSWQLALQGKRGLQTVPLPSRIVIDERNPWNPFVYLEDSTAGIFCMDLMAHRRAIDPKRLMDEIQQELGSEEAVIELLKKMDKKVASASYHFRRGRYYEGVLSNGDESAYMISVDGVLAFMGRAGAYQDRIAFRYTRDQIKEGVSSLIQDGNPKLRSYGTFRELDRWDRVVVKTDSAEVRVVRTEPTQAEASEELRYEIPAQILFEKLRELNPEQ